MKPSFISSSILNVFLLSIIITFSSNLLFGQDKKVELTYTGSSTIGGLIELANELYPNAYFTIDTRQESEGGVDAILGGRTDLAGLARTPDNALLNTGVNAKKIGEDAIAVILNDGISIKNLTAEQLKQIFNGTLTNWQNLGGPDLEIKPFITEERSATHSVFRSAILGSEEYQGCTEITPDFKMLEIVRNTPGAIGQISLSFLSEVKGMHVCAVEGMLPSSENEDYLITRELYLLYWPGRKSVTDFIGWLDSPEAQGLIGKKFIRNTKLSGKEQLPRIRYSGSSTIGRFMEQAAAAYPYASFSFDLSIESLGGEREIVAGETDLAGVAKSPDYSTLQKGVVSTYLDQDDIAIIVHPGTGVDNLSHKQLKQIFTGKVLNWKEVGGADVPIKPFLVDEQSATHHILKDNILGEEDFQGCETAVPDQAIIGKVANTKGGIGQISMTFLEEESGVNVVSVNGTFPHSGPGYPLRRSLHLLWYEKNQQVANFIDWINSKKGKEMVKAYFKPSGELIIRDPGLPMAQLEVFTKTFPFVDGGIYYYPHLPYELLDEEGNSFMLVKNNSGVNDETPEVISIPPGTYSIVPKNTQDGPYTVELTPGSTTSVRLRGGAAEVETVGGVGSTFKGGSQTSLWSHLRFYGDLRIRANYDDRGNGNNRFRGRYRLRAGLNAELLPGLSLGFRVVSSEDPDNPNSTHVDFKDGFNDAYLLIDRAFVRWNPGNSQHLTLIAGKSALPFRSSQLFPELIWDDDIQPAGGTVMLDYTKNQVLSYYGGSAGVYQITSFVTGQDAPWLGTYQLRANFQAGEKSRFQLNTGLFYYDKIKGLSTSNGDLDNNSGNSVDIGNDGKPIYATNFHIFNHFVNYIYSGLKKPLSIKAQIFHNTGASENNLGYALGASIGDLQDKGHCRTYYQYQRVEQDAVFSPIAQDDFLLATQFTGHVLSYAYAISSKVNLELWALWSKKIEDGASYQGRYRLDVNMKF